MFQRTVPASISASDIVSIETDLSALSLDREQVDVSMIVWPSTSQHSSPLPPVKVLILNEVGSCSDIQWYLSVPFANCIAH
jgi:hypothetical protein